MDFRTSTYRRGLIVLAVVAGLVLAAVLLFKALLATGGFSMQAFWLVVAILIDLLLISVLLYWAVATLGLAYRLDRNGLAINWGASRLIVPMNHIQDIVPGTYLREQLGRAAAFPAKTGGCWWRRVKLVNGKWAYLRTSLPLAESMAVLTANCAYVISPDRSRDFVDAWQVRRPLGPTQLWREEEKRSWLLGLPVWRDRIAWALVGGAVIMALVSFGYLASIYDQLPEVLSLHFDALGQPDRTGGPSQVLSLPLVAFALLSLDLVLGFALYRTERVAAYLMWGGALALQILAWGALFTVTA